jgi:2-(1,2-epoxy-1,2-dihydrophenyl)acetyl-CoA isomerase
MTVDPLNLEDVRLRQVGAVAIATLNRPEKLNALRGRSVADLSAVIDYVEASEDVRALVLTGAGRGFCAGEDMAEMSETLAGDGIVDSLPKRVAVLQELTQRIVGLPIPVIAAVNGPAVGLGAELALNCDIRVAARGALIGFPEVKRGLMVTNGGLYLLPRLVGHARTRELVMGGELINAARAEQIGLVNEVVADGEVVARARQLAENMAANAPIAIAALKRILEEAWDRPLAEVLDLEADALLRCAASADGNEGVAAYHDGRAPRFEGA